MFFRNRIEVKTAAQVELMRAAGLLVGQTLELMRQSVAPGVTPRQLDTLAEEHIRDGGGVPSFLGYQGFPATLCTSVNERVVHGIPDDRPLEPGDIISIDCGAIVAGWHGDAAITVPVGEVRPEVRALIDVAEDALWSGLAAAVPTGRLHDISAAIERSVDARGEYGIVEGYHGHGIGTEMHQDPEVPNCLTRGRGPRLRPGVVLAVEPMITLGSAETEVLADDWTVVTADGSWAAHAEHTVAVTEEGPWVLTALDGGAARLGA